METIALTFVLPEDLHDHLVAELADLGFEAFVNHGEELIAYGPARVGGESAGEEIKRWLEAHGIREAPSASNLPSENWNAKWEASIQPLDVGPFVIAPTWAERAEPLPSKPVLLIDPKMSFGTGHHESTRVALRLVHRLALSGDRFLDAGTGTGILAIAALRSGAERALGFDIDPASIANARENARLNEVADRFEIREGTTQCISEEDFDLIAANLIRSRLLPMLPALASALAAGGRLILAGLLANEKVETVASLRAIGLVIVDEEAENEWWGCAARRAAEVDAAETGTAP